MVRRNASLKPHLNQIRTWVGEGVTDIWIAHQLASTPSSIASFRRQHGLHRGGDVVIPPVVAAAGMATAAPLAVDPGEDVGPSLRFTGQLRDEQLLPIESFLEAAQDPARMGGILSLPCGFGKTDAAPAKRRRRGRRGGRGRGRAGAAPITAALEHGADGLVIRIDAALLDQPAYADTWAGVLTAEVTLTPEGITLIAPVTADSE